MRGMEVTTSSFIRKEQAERAMREPRSHRKPAMNVSDFLCSLQTWVALVLYFPLRNHQFLSRDLPMIPPRFWKRDWRVIFLSLHHDKDHLQKREGSERAMPSWDRQSLLQGQTASSLPVKSFTSWGKMAEHWGNCVNLSFRYKPWCAENMFKDCWMLCSSSHSKLSVKTMCPTQEFLREGWTRNSQSQERDK